jgi:hypothetical protein
LWVYAGPSPERVVVEERNATVDGNPWKDLAPSLSKAPVPGVSKDAVPGVSKDAVPGVSKDAVPAVSKDAVLSSSKEPAKS